MFKQAPDGCQDSEVTAIISNFISPCKWKKGEKGAVSTSAFPFGRSAFQDFLTKSI
jgi:hypothetical protein